LLSAFSSHFFFIFSRFRLERISPLSTVLTCDELLHRGVNFHRLFQLAEMAGVFNHIQLRPNRMLKKA
jgi:hypothetical protein